MTKVTKGSRLICILKGHIDSTKHLQADEVNEYGEFFGFPSSSYCMRCHRILFCGKPTNFTCNGIEIKYIEEWYTRQELKTKGNSG